MAKTYTLKYMALARLIAEILTLAVMALTPVVALMLGHFQNFPHNVRLMLAIASPIAWLILPFYGFVTWRVHVEAEGFKTESLLKKQFVAWQSVESCRLVANWKLRQYVVAYQDGETSFPVLLKDADELVSLIRSHVPAAVGLAARETMYKRDLLGMIGQYAGLLAGLVFIGVFWQFCFSLFQSQKIEDAIVAVIGCVTCTLVLAWYCFIVLVAPYRVRLDDSGVLLKSLFFERQIPWSDVTGTRPTIAVLPDGFILNTTDGWFLMSASFCGADEMQQAIERKLKSNIGV